MDECSKKKCPPSNFLPQKIKEYIVIKIEKTAEKGKIIFLISFLLYAAINAAAPVIMNSCQYKYSSAKSFIKYKILNSLNKSNEIFNAPISRNDTKLIYPGEKINKIIDA